VKLHRLVALQARPTDDTLGRRISTALEPGRGTSKLTPGW
jgi:hypothetical protein